MIDMIANAVTVMDGVRKTHLAQLVTYARGADEVSIAATLGITTYEITDEYGATVQAKATDFIFTAAELILATVTITPAIGDRISLPAGDVTRVFEVLELAGTGHYSLMDPSGTMLRVHAKQIDEV